MSNTLVFTLALNGYQWRYSQLLNTHKAYADACGYEYVAVTRPRLSNLGLEVAWLKIRLVLQALRAGYQWVVFLDADTRVNENTPPISTLDTSGKVIFMSKGFSGRFNSGVMIIKNSLQSNAFFTSVINNATRPIPKEDDVGWGENGHIIHYAKDCDYIAHMDQRWNNNYQPDLDDYIRHYSRGPLHGEYLISGKEQLMSHVYRYSLAITKRLNTNWVLNTKSPHAKKLELNRMLDRAMHKVLKHYPQFR